MHTKYLIGCEVVTPHIQEHLRVLRAALGRKLWKKPVTPTFGHVTFFQPFTASHETASRINLAIEVSALRLSMGESLFVLGEARFFEGEEVDTLYLEVRAEGETLEFLKKMRNKLFSLREISVLGQRLDDGTPNLHVTLFQGKNISRKSRLLEAVARYNSSIKNMNEEDLVVFETFIPVMYQRCKAGWKILGSHFE